MRFNSIRTPALVLLYCITSCASLASMQQTGSSELASSIAPENQTGGDSAEASACSMVRALAKSDFQQFKSVLYRCDDKTENEIANEYGQFLHLTQLSDCEGAVCVYDLRRALQNDSICVVGKGSFSPDPRLCLSVGGTDRVIVDVSIEGIEGHRFNTRLIVVQRSNERWYCIPRLRDTLPYYDFVEQAALNIPVPEERK